MVAVDLFAATLTGILWFIGGLLMFVVFALCTPLRLSASAYGVDVSEGEGICVDETRWQLRTVWLFGLLRFSACQNVGEPVRIQLRLLGIPVRVAASGRSGSGKAPGKKGRGQAERRRAPQGQQRQAKRGARLAPHEIGLLLGEMRWFLRQMRRTVRLRARGDLVYGFTDPAVTGWFEGLRSILELPRQLRLDPNFDEAVLQGWVDVHLTVYPIGSAWVVGRGIFRKGIRRIWWPRLRQRLPWMRKESSQRVAVRAE